MQKFLILIGFTILAFGLQVLIAPWLAIGDIAPDFVLIMVLFVGILRGRLYGQLYGFSTGLVVDAIGAGSLLGLSVLTKTVAGFAAGFTKDQKSRLNPFTFYALNLIIVFIHFAIFYLIRYHGSESTIQFILLRYVLPETVYTGIFFILIEYIFSTESLQ